MQKRAEKQSPYVGIYWQRPNKHAPWGKWSVCKTLNGKHIMFTNCNSHRDALVALKEASKIHKFKITKKKLTKLEMKAYQLLKRAEEKDHKRIISMVKKNMTKLHLLSPQK